MKYCLSKDISLHSVMFIFLLDLVLKQFYIKTKVLAILYIQFI